jgi:hypothetical protein
MSIRLGTIWSSVNGLYYAQIWGNVGKLRERGEVSAGLREDYTGLGEAIKEKCLAAVLLVERRSVARTHFAITP